MIETTGVPWASATFVGERHVVTAELDEAAMAAFVAGIEEAEFTLTGHLVADVAVVARAGGQVVLEALTVEEV